MFGLILANQTRGQMEVTKEYAFSSGASRWQPGPFLSAKPLFLSCFALRRLLVNLGQEDAEVCVPGHFDGVLCAPQKNGTSTFLFLSKARFETEVCNLPNCKKKWSQKFANVPWPKWLRVYCCALRKPAIKPLPP